MTQPDISLESATDMLSRAFMRLEQAVDGAARRSQSAPSDLPQIEASFRQQIGALQAENFQLREENQTLYERLGQAREEMDELQVRNEQIAYQIDRQIEQLELMA